MRSKKLSLGLAAVLAMFTLATLMTATRAAAQMETVLTNFQIFGSSYFPSSGLIFDASGNLYGVTDNYYTGAVYELTPNGSGGWTQKALHNFGSGTDGADAQGNLIMDGSGNLYGTTVYGGTGACNTGTPGCGTVFELKALAGGRWVERVIYSFNNDGSDGNYPGTGVISDSNGNLYGTTGSGGAYGEGTVFQLKPQANGNWQETVLHSFGSGTDGTSPVAVIFDGSGNLYGVTSGSGTNSGNGVVFELTPSAGGWSESILYTFTDGDDPEAGLVFDQSGNLYGTTGWGGVYRFGSVFELSPAGGGSWTESVLHSFNRDGNDGNQPRASVVLDASGNIYGTTEFGGKGGTGVVYELTPAGGGTYNETILRNFSEIERGYYLYWNLILDSSGNLYGTTTDGGVDNGGTVFELTP